MWQNGGVSVKRVVAGVLVVAVLGAGGYWVVNRRAAATATTGALLVASPVLRGDIRQTVSGTGPVASQNGVMVQARVAGTVQQVLFGDGDRVEAGQPVAILASDSVMAALKQAQLDLDTARTNLESARRSVRHGGPVCGAKGAER